MRRLVFLSSVLLALLAVTGEEERLPGWLGEVARLRGGSSALPAPPTGLPELGALHPDPSSIELVSWAPRAWLYHGFLSAAECKHLIDLARPTLTKSTVVDTATGKSVPSQIRTSKGTFLHRGHDDVVEDIERRIAEFAMVPVENGEGIQILQYNIGEKYEAHYDYFHDKFNADPAKGGQRVATVLMYLSDVEEGGETVFPASPEKPTSSGGTWSPCARRGVAVHPSAGDALLFFSLDLQQQLDPASLHASCPVVRGVKFSATKWMHVSAFGGEAVRRKGCANYHDSCDTWAAAGECVRNAAYMTGADGSQGDCLKACGKCK